MKVGAAIEITQRKYEEIYSKRKGRWIQVAGEYHRFVVTLDEEETYPQTREGAIKVIRRCIDSDSNAGAGLFVKGFVENNKVIFVDDVRYTGQEMAEAIKQEEEQDGIDLAELAEEELEEHKE